MKGKMFVIFDTEALYNAQKNDVEARDIVFIRDARKVITHGITFTDQKTVDATLASIQTALNSKLSTITAADYSVVIAGSGTSRTVKVNTKTGGGLTRDANGLYVDTSVIATKSSVDTLSTTLTTLSNNTYRKSETYTQKEVNDRIATVSGSVYRVAGSVDTFADLPATNVASIGDVYNIVTAFTFEGKPYPAGTNVVLANKLEGGTTTVDWDPLGGTVDLSGYVAGTNTVNNKPLSTNPVLGGADIKATGYTIASSVTAVTPTDTLNIALGKIEKRATVATSDINAVKAYTVNGKTLSTNPVLGGADVKITGYTLPAAYSEVVTTDNVNTAIGKLHRLGTDINSRVTAATKYTVNGQQISTNPILGGANIKLTGYTVVTGGKLAATDTINAALRKLDEATTALDWEEITA